MKRKLPFLFVLFFFSSCFMVTKVMTSWEKHHYSQLIASWGPPQQVFEDGLGGRILVYTISRQLYSPGTSTTYTTVSATAYDDYIWGSATSRTVYNPAMLYGYTAYRMFWINKDGIIYSWRWKGL